MPSNHLLGRHVADETGRRRVLALGAGAAATLLAGCSTVMDLLAGFVLSDVNVVNATDRHVSGSITVTDPGDDVVLDDRFDLEPEADEDEDEDRDTMSTYDGVLTDPGEYTVAVEMDEGDEIDGERATEETVEVSEPDDEHVLVILGGEEAIRVEVIDEFTDVEEFDG